MWRLAVAAVVIAAFIQPVGAQTRQLELLAAEMRICQALMKNDAAAARECVADVKRGLAEEKARLALQMGRGEIAREFLARHGIVEPDIDAKFQVARRRGVLFAVILSECLRSRGSVEELGYCLDQREKAETWLGNAMNEPQ